ncbi:hypothetical protein LCL97_22950 [Seohaeicola saemankumensis]|nr:hypothetical protein [Seohaeicola saemankumensis]MCA0873702.1 hypothetical protein [Seohaeicola saemankumensis]
MLRTIILCAGLLPGAAFATDAVKGEETTFTSPNGVTERCVRIARMPGAVYSKDDRKTEAEYCALDLYAPTVALCPKTWSTSPGMMIYDISKGPYAGDRSGFERHACAEGKSAKQLAKDSLAKFKPTMNAKGTSGTFSASSLMYYHFSRYFEADIGVPPAVWRSMDRGAHSDEVASRGLSISGHGHSSGMNHAGWRKLVDAEKNPKAYSPTSELFTADRKALYGALLNSPGSRYGSEVNGTRASGWGKGQNLDFQETAPFRALRSGAPIEKAISEGIEEAIKTKQIRRDMGPDVDPRQVAYWMTDIANIVLLDFIFSQQDRIGNIDYKTRWMWVENGEVKSHKAENHSRDRGKAPQTAIRIKRTHLNDNDAGGRVAYANFTKSTQMLEKLRHFPAKTYRKLAALDADFRVRGPLYTYVQDSFGLTNRQVAQVVKNTALAFGILSETCKRGELIFDLEPETFFLKGTVTPADVDCAAG